VNGNCGKIGGGGIVSGEGMVIYPLNPRPLESYLLTGDGCIENLLKYFF
jgi:hypothetical protein